MLNEDMKRDMRTLAAMKSFLGLKNQGQLPKWFFNWKASCNSISNYKCTLTEPIFFSAGFSPVAPRLQLRPASSNKPDPHMQRRRDQPHTAENREQGRTQEAKKTCTCNTKH